MHIKICSSGLCDSALLNSFKRHIVYLFISPSTAKNEHQIPLMEASSHHESIKSRCAHTYKHTFGHSWESAGWSLHHLPSLHLTNNARMVDYAKLNVSAQWDDLDGCLFFLKASSQCFTHKRWRFKCLSFFFPHRWYTKHLQGIFSKISCDRIIKSLFLASFFFFFWKSSAPR